MSSKADEFFIDACRSAKVVETIDGPAILIAGHVIGIRSSAPDVHVDGITRALRRACSDGSSADYSLPTGLKIGASQPTPPAP